ncbi:cell division protein FtsQ/DivIB [Aureibaculum sp. 2210JD6-5]|uniref:cell division protein FtsQ/DivIB n=1 Tax=Aureibaculum sp. 2210JD6-5 TaxID=3103957 RepID=UPI002AAE158A|nr:cell division protein FtsQ/DivIB [Aureibaculum sp. 2210JD6-5]MDY7394522.1 cell division protein FtsQ/DivIB [Aureibaculum sp. 2210JD6-5]
MKKYIPLLKGVLLLIFVVLLYGFSSARNKTKRVEKVNINFENGDNLFITYETVNKLLVQNFGRLQSQPKENLFLNKLEETLLTNEMVENAEVFIDVDGKLGASIKQKTPIARINDGGMAYYMDSNGKRMPLSSNYSARVPIVEGIENNQISSELFKLATIIDNDEFLKKQVVGIQQKPENKFVLKTRIGNQEVELGTLNQLDQKIKKLKVFYQKVINDKTLNNYKTINLEYNNQVVCTKN